MFDPTIASQLTTQDYAPPQTIEGVEIVTCKEFTDDGGSFFEIGRFDGGAFQGIGGPAVRQANYSVLMPGVIKATHLHKTQVDYWLVPPQDRLLVGLRDIRAGSATKGVTMRFVLGAGKARMVRIPNGVAHGVANPYERPMALLYFVTEQFTPDPQACDEFRLPPWYFGDDFWKMQAG